MIAFVAISAPQDVRRICGSHAIYKDKGAVEGPVVYITTEADYFHRTNVGLSICHF
jgi:hypothetical protein